MSFTIKVKEEIIAASSKDITTRPISRKIAFTRFLSLTMSMIFCPIYNWRILSLALKQVLKHQ